MSGSIAMQRLLRVPFSLFGYNYGPSVLMSARIVKTFLSIPRTLWKMIVTGAVPILYSLCTESNKLEEKQRKDIETTVKTDPEPTDAHL